LAGFVSSGGELRREEKGEPKFDAKEGESVLKAVTFDFWNTLVREREAESVEQVVIRRFQDLFRTWAQERTRAEIAAVTKACRDLVMAGQVNEGKEMPPEAQLKWIFQRLRIDTNPELEAAAHEAYTTASLEVLPLPVTGVAQVLPKLKEHLTLAVICNTGRTPGSIARVILERLGLLHYFSYLAFSNELGVAKPHPAIFQKTIAELGVRPNEAAHIGDDPRTDVKGSKAVGMYSIWFNPRGSASAEVACDLMLTRYEDLVPWVLGQSRRTE
jgi:putative hydrolase of the HAD superfamily